METLNSKKLFEKAKKSIPGGVNSPVRAFRSVNRDYPVFIRKAKGSRLYDEDGKEYIDCIGSWGPMILGHNHPEVMASVREAIENGTSFGLPTGKEIDLAELVKECFPSIEKLRLTTSGTEAAMAAVRLARAYTGKNKVLKFEGCYHGHSDSLLVKAGSGLLTFQHQDSNGITAGVIKDTVTLPFGDIEALREKVREDKDIACIIMEPVPANMGLIVTESGYLKEVRKISKEKDIVLIFDEVISGFRLALGGAQELYGIIPDITVLGKIIGGGYPVGAFGGKKEIMDMISPLGNVYHAGTLSGNPVSVTAGIRTITLLRDNPQIYEEINERTGSLAGSLRELTREYGLKAAVNHLGSLFTIFFSSNSVSCLEDAINTSDEEYAVYFDVMLSNGIMVPPSKYEAHFISLAHTDEDMERISRAAEEAFKRIAAKMK